MIRKEVLKSGHQKRVESFMRKAGQGVPDAVTIPDGETRVLRAKLIMEEAMETVKALGVVLYCDGDGSVDLLYADLGFSDKGVEYVDVPEVVDGCCDIKVVTTGTLSAFGVADDPCQIEVDNANLRKFAEGGYRREDGKWIKPADWRPPNWVRILGEQGYLIK